MLGFKFEIEAQLCATVEMVTILGVQQCKSELQVQLTWFCLGAYCPFGGCGDHCPVACDVGGGPFGLHCPFCDGLGYMVDGCAQPLLS